MIRLTPSGWFLVGASLLLYLSSLTSQSSLLFFLVGLLLGCVLVNTVAAWRALRDLQLRMPASVHLAEGEPFPASWEIVNEGPRPASLVRIESGGQLVGGLSGIAARSKKSLFPKLSFQQRGVYPYREMRLVCMSPFGLVRVSKTCLAKGEVVVEPAVYPAVSPAAAGYDHMLGGRLKGLRRSGSGADFAGIRPFLDGDAFKQIHWKSSAKGLGWMVKTYDEELSGRITFLFDGGHPERPGVLDDCLRAAASLMFAALEAGHHLEAIHLETCSPMLVPPFDDGEDLLDSLARISPTAGTLTRERLHQALLRASRRSALCLVLTELNSDAAAFIEEVQAHHRIVTVYLPAEGASIEPAVSAPLFHYDKHEVMEG